MLKNDPGSEPERGAKKRKPFIIPGYIGMTVLLMSVLLMVVFPSQVSQIPDGFFTPIIAFEFIETSEEVHAFFGTAGSQDYEETLRKMNIGNQLDFIYLALYGIFLIAFSFQMYTLSGNRWYLLGIVTSLVVMAGDILENVQLLGITSRLSTGDFDQQLALLQIFTWLKWGGLVVTFLILAPFVRTMNRIGKATSVVILLSLVLGITALMNRGVATELFSVSVAAVFLLMIISCFIYTGKKPV